MPISKDFAEFLRLIDVSGPFLSLPVLGRTFAGGFEKAADETDRRRALKEAFFDWDDPDRDEGAHRKWVRFVLEEFLAWPKELLLFGQSLPPGLTATLAEHGVSLAPDFALVDPPNRTPARKARVLVKVEAPGQRLDKALKDRWSASPQTRMQELLRATDVRLGLVTNGEEWCLVHAAPGETTGFATWQAPLWFEEPLTLRAFASLLSTRRFFGVPDAETPESLYAESAKDQQEVTDQLGAQVRRSVELLVWKFDQLNRESGGTLLAGISERDFYEACVTVMMRLVFLLAAEERGLLRLGEEFYDDNYAASTLLQQLRATADRHGEEVLERRHEAWARLLATFRAVHGGVEHEDMRLPAYGGSLFDPDKYAFLEGRPWRLPPTSWREDPAVPPAVDDRTVLHLLESLQELEVRVAGGTEKRRLSFRALDVEQIGHVYEGLLDHTVKTARGPVLGLAGAKRKEPEIPLASLEEWAAEGPETLVEKLVEETGKSENALRRALEAASPADRLLIACDNDHALAKRVAPFSGLLRADSFDRLVVIPDRARYVTQGSDRRSTGTHYTPRALTEEIVKHALDPLVYEGPAEGRPAADWKLKPARELLALRVCDFAMGSGAFLVEACRFLSAKLVEAWTRAEEDARGRLVVTPEGDLSQGRPGERPLPQDRDERLAIARRVVADRCLYGVDRNHMAVEMAKLSLWLVTLQKDKPFEFLDHALRCGDSLLGLTSVDQLVKLHPAPAEDQKAYGFLSDDLREALEFARGKRRQLEALGSDRPEDIATKQRLLAEADAALWELRVVADLVIGAALQTAGRGREALREEMDTFAAILAKAFGEKRGSDKRRVLFEELRARAVGMIGTGRERPTFHWMLEFPEVVSSGDGFTGFVGNPPFLGGLRIPAALGDDYREYILQVLAHGVAGVRGTTDLCAYFVLRADELLASFGTAGLITTNTIAQGDTELAGLRRIVSHGAEIFRATSSQPWPGEAALEIAKIFFTRQTWAGERILDGTAVSNITSKLEPVQKHEALDPFRLLTNQLKAFQGSIPLGMGFVLDTAEKDALLGAEPAAAEVLKPFVSGEDLNSIGAAAIRRWTLFWRDMPLAEVQARFPKSLQRIETLVKPERDAYPPTSSWNRTIRERWWQFAAPRYELYSALETCHRALAVAGTSRTLAFEFIAKDRVFANTLYVFALDDFADFAVMQSCAQDSWARKFGSSMKDDLRYTGASCFETFPRPERTHECRVAGERFHSARAQVMTSHESGLTDFVKLLNNPARTDSDISSARELLVAVDQAVAAAYGWTDLDLEHGFHATKQGQRFTISERARREVLRRLLELNHQRYAEEVAAGLHEKKKEKKPAAPRAPGAPKKPAEPTEPKPTTLDLFAQRPDGLAKPAPKAARGAAAPATPSEKVRALLENVRPEALGKAEILERAGVEESEWKKAVTELLDAGTAVQEGTRRGAKYRAT